MILAAILVVGFLGLYLMAIYAEGRDRRWLQRLYDERVGLDLTALVELLPEELRDKEFLEIKMAPLTPGMITVGLTYKTDAIYRGGPPNVGLVFDMADGHLVKVVPGGVGLGQK